MVYRKWWFFNDLIDKNAIHRISNIGISDTYITRSDEIFVQQYPIFKPDALKLPSLLKRSNWPPRTVTGHREILIAQGNQSPWRYTQKLWQRALLSNNWFYKESEDPDICNLKWSLFEAILCFWEWILRNIKLYQSIKTRDGQTDPCILFDWILWFSFQKLFETNCKTVSIWIFIHVYMYRM